MARYLVTFTPVEPYFFGNEKSFKYPGQRNPGQQSNQYFIRSEATPSQTTLLGALRYIFLPIKKSDFSYTAEEKDKNESVTGKYSFDISSSCKQRFGIIKSISPLFLVNNGEYFVPTPFDHTDGKEVYTPFSDYKSISTPDGEKYYVESYSSKNGITSSYMRLSDGKIYESDKLFSAEVRVGINRGSQEKGFFKKEYKVLQKNVSFGVFAELDTDNVPAATTVFLGQGKSAFIVKFEKNETELTSLIKPHLKNGVAYCFGDSFVCSNVYNSVKFAVTKTKDYRSYITDNEKIKKGSVLYKVLCAGSVFIPDDKSAFKNAFMFENAEQIGFNNVIISEEDN